MGDLLPHMNAGREMPRYRSHKLLWALKIKLVVPELKGEMTLHFYEEGYEPLRVTSEYVRKHEPRRDGYYVVYDDGYTSWSPALAFEKGNRPIGPATDVQRKLDGKFALTVRDGVAVLINHLTGIEVPPDEPLFIFRGRDQLALPKLRGYLDDCQEAGCTAYQIEGVKTEIAKFDKFAIEHEDRMKMPGSSGGK